MPNHFDPHRLLRPAAGLVGTGALVAAALVATPSAAAPSAGGGTAGSDAGRTGRVRRLPDVDARRGSTPAAVAAQRRTAARVAARPQARALRRSLGSQAVLDIDGTTGTVRLLGRLDGYLTGPSRLPAATVATRYVTAHHDALGLSTDALTTFDLDRDYRDVDGTHHLSWTQRIGDQDVFGNGLTASVSRRGRLLTVGGSPVTEAAAATPGRARLPDRSAAIRAARRDLGERVTAPGRRDVARRVLFVTARSSHPGWQTVTMSAQNPALSVLDARTGRLLFRRSLSARATEPEPSTARAFEYFPRAPRGGTAHLVDVTARGWLPRDATELSGNNSHAYSDVDDDNLVEGSEEVRPTSGHSWNRVLKPFHPAGVSFCDNPYPCSWNPDEPFSWRTNRAQNATQVFFFVNRWHDHLAAAPIGFTEAAGNFQLANHTSQGRGGDAVDTQTDDGADTDHGLPDGLHIDNANMDTPPDGMAPRMQMYLQHQPGTSYPDGDPFSPTNVGDEADTVYHEYTHGLSNRLVLDATGNSGLFEGQSGAMGEAWSDWYAMDYLVDRGLQPDVPGTADIVLFQYDGDGVFLDRTEPIDCKVGSSSTRCTGGRTGHSDGYTYADYAHVVGTAEVHGDGEIWSQTLWDLRDALGSRTAEALVTRAMELTPVDPSFLDERNAILMADTAVRHGADRARIWRVFARRGMGYFAGSLGAQDAAPAPDFHTPPHSSATAFVTGKVTDDASHEPLAGVPVTLAFQGGGPVNPTAISGADGRYRLGPVPVGRYGKLGVVRGGYDGHVRSVTVTRAGAHADFAVRRNWAARSGGAAISAFTGPDFSSFGCGPEQAIDESLVAGWASTTGNDNGDPTGTFTPKRLVISLPEAVDVLSYRVDPSATCGDDETSSLGAYTLQTSTDGTTWTPSASGSFDAADDGRLNTVTAAGGRTAVRYVRLTMRGNQTPGFAATCPGGSVSGCSFTDMTEIKVYGVQH